jgi:hypothetical protein
MDKALSVLLIESFSFQSNSSIMGDLFPDNGHDAFLARLQAEKIDLWAILPPAELELALYCRIRHLIRYEHDLPVVIEDAVFLGTILYPNDAAPSKLALKSKLNNLEETFVIRDAQNEEERRRQGIPVHSGFLTSPKVLYATMVIGYHFHRVYENNEALFDHIWDLVTTAKAGGYDLQSMPEWLGLTIRLGNCPEQELIEDSKRDPLESLVILHGSPDLLQTTDLDQLSPEDKRLRRIGKVLQHYGLEEIDLQAVLNRLIALEN